MSTMTAATTPVPAQGSAPLRLLKAELLKLWTTNSWWIFGILTLTFTGLTLVANLFVAHSELTYAEEARNQPPPDFGQHVPPGEGGPTADEIKRMEADYAASIDVAKILVRSAANIYTSGQFFALVFMVILGALIVTNEFFHQTATTTFLTTPHRTQVILSKLAAAVVVAIGFWLAITVINLSVGSAYFGLTGHSIPLTDGPLLRSVLMNVLAFVIWAVLGVGLGVLIRSQLGATITGAAAYFVSFPAVFIAFGLIRQYIIKEDWVLNWIVIAPGVASQIMVDPEPFQLGPDQTGPAWWVGALVLVGYGVVASVVGTLITRVRDIS